MTTAAKVGPVAMPPGSGRLESSTTDGEKVRLHMTAFLAVRGGSRRHYMALGAVTHGSPPLKVVLRQQVRGAPGPCSPGHSTSVARTAH